MQWCSRVAADIMKETQSLGPNTYRIILEKKEIEVSLTFRAQINKLSHEGSFGFCSGLVGCVVLFSQAAVLNSQMKSQIKQSGWLDMAGGLWFVDRFPPSDCQLTGNSENRIC